MTYEENFARRSDAREVMARTRLRLSYAITVFGVAFAILFGRLVEVSLFRVSAGPKAAHVAGDVIQIFRALI